jgi:excisionase family DNA binding protein
MSKENGRETMGENKKVTLEISGRTTPERLLETIRQQSPGLLVEPPPAGDPRLPAGPEKLLTPAEVASMFRVDPKTVTRWAATGKLTSIRTLGGHRRYRESEVRALLYGSGSALDGES